MRGRHGKVADALEIIYILAGTMMRHGMQDVIVKVFQEIRKQHVQAGGRRPTNLRKTAK